MATAQTYSAMLSGLKAEKISVEIDISNGLHSFSIVGLGDRAVEEAKDRVAAGIKNTGYVSPKQKNQKVVISLAPADLRKEGPSFDLAMAIGYLIASNEICFDASNTLFIGELSLEGHIRKVSGLLPILCQAKDLGFTEVYIPKENMYEATLVKEIRTIPVSTLRETLDYLSGATTVGQQYDSDTIVTYDADQPIPNISNKHVDMNAIRGNEQAKRGLEIAAAGAHNVIMYGPPGTGKTMLAHSFHSILPNLTHEQSVEVTSIHSIAKIADHIVIRPPFRSPHHTASSPAIVGGGSIPKPGEITLAHRGVIFLDEFPEFDRAVMEALRQPLEEKEITISRARGTVTFPAQCILIASMNPCPCGRGEGGCTCTPRSVNQYKQKISGPIADRVDIWLNVHKIDYQKLGSVDSHEESSAIIAVRVEKARKIQQKRFYDFGIDKNYNSEMETSDIEICAKLSDESRVSFTNYAEKLQLSARVFHRIIKVARTIADLDDSTTVEEKHILEALTYRQRY